MCVRRSHIKASIVAADERKHRKLRDLEHCPCNVSAFHETILSIRIFPRGVGVVVVGGVESCLDSS